MTPLTSPVKDLPIRKMAALDQAIAEISAWETSVPTDLKAFKLRENAETFAEGEHAAVIGPMPDRGPATGVVLYRGTLAGSWGTPQRPDIAFSVTKAALATMAGLALGEGLIPALDSRVSDVVPLQEFAENPNKDITWRHLLTFTSEWRGMLWGIPDSIDWNRAVPSRPGAPAKGSHRLLRDPGEYWEFNDVRVNVLALALTHLWREPLPDVFKRQVMDPIGASGQWRWGGYDNAFAAIGGRRVPVVAGGAHWGGGLVISALDLARLGLLYARRGRCDGQAIFPTLWLDLVSSPTALNPDFGMMWWNNFRGSIASLSRRAIWCSGIANLLLVDPDEDLVLVIRWHDAARRDRMIEKIVQALAAGSTAP